MSHRLLTLVVLGFAGHVCSAQADVDFVKEIQPILEKSCVKCHGPEKPKAGLRIDTKEGLLKGSKDGKVIHPGMPEKSSLYERVILGKDQDGRMPPEGEPLAKAQTELLKKWIAEGAKWPDGVALKVPGVAKPTIEDTGLPISDKENAAVANIKKTGALAMRLAQNSNWLRIDFNLQKPEMKDELLAQLKDIPNLMELNLGGTAISDGTLAHLKDCANLQKLQLHNTKITDAGLEHLKGLKKLNSLNLYGTAVTDNGIEQLKDLKSLKKIYVWQTKVSEEGAKKMASTIPGLYVDRGYDLEAKPPAKPDAKPDAKPAKPDAKPDAKPAKPDAKPAKPAKPF